MSSSDPQMKVRLPLELFEWVKRQAQENRSTLSSEISRAVRERKQRTTTNPRARVQAQ